MRRQTWAWLAVLLSLILYGNIINREEVQTRAGVFRGR